MEQQQLKKLKRKILLIFPLGMLGYGLLIFVPAWTLDFWQAWLVMAILFIPVFFVVAYFLKHDPELLARRTQYREKLGSEKIIVNVAGFLYLAGLTLPGFDLRYGWSHVPVWLTLMADVMVFLGYMLVFLVFKVNSYASRIIEVTKGQKLITTGPYAIVRHPMYAGTIIMYLFIPLALGSYVALVSFIPITTAIILRIFDEEKLLKKELQGYKEYMQKVKYRLIPGIW